MTNEYCPDSTKRIYLAGKIGKNDWRHDIVSGLSGAISGGCPPDDHAGGWPILNRAIFRRFDYVGPFFTSCDHGCWHGENEHGSNADRRDYNGYPSLRERVLENCCRAIAMADLVFVWLDSMDAYGTVAEVGYARGLAAGRAAGCGGDGRPDIYIAVPRGFDAGEEMWLPSCMATSGGAATDKTPGEALREYLIEAGWFFDSPLERSFYYEWFAACCRADTYLPLELQHEVLNGRYRLDFAHLPTKTAIELDGFTYHGDRKQFTRDRKRDRELTEAGWRVIRFAGQEVISDAGKCAEQAARMIRQSMELNNGGVPA